MGLEIIGDNIVDFYSYFWYDNETLIELKKELSSLVLVDLTGVLKIINLSYIVFFCSFKFTVNIFIIISYFLEII